MSAASLASPDLVDRVRDELHRSQADPLRLHLEVTETTVFDITAGVRETMAEIAALGASWWVDDFGTGFSSVSHLRDLPIDGLKLDRSFTDDLMADNGRARQIAQGLAGLSTGLALVTVAEGVETAQQAAILQSQGWKYGQGWFYGRAQPPDHYLAGDFGSIR